MRSGVLILLIIAGIVYQTSADWRDDMKLRFIIDKLYRTSQMLVTVGKLFDDMKSEQKTVSIRQAMQEYAELTNGYVSSINVCVELIENEVEAFNCCIEAEVDMIKNTRNITRLISGQSG